MLSEVPHRVQGDGRSQHPSALTWSLLVPGGFTESAQAPSCQSWLCCGKRHTGTECLREAVCVCP